jgi:hypothetical protein
LFVYALLDRFIFGGFLEGDFIGGGPDDEDGTSSLREGGRRAAKALKNSEDKKDGDHDEGWQDDAQED